MLKIREDDISYQGFTSLDKKVYFRRLKKTKIDTFTDANIGALSAIEAARMFGEFIILSGGLKTKTIKFTNISPNEGDTKKVTKRFDLIKELFNNLFDSHMVECSNSYLDLDLDHFDAIFEIQYSPNLQKIIDTSKV